MKKNKKAIIFVLLEMIFMMLVPVVLLWTEYGDSMVGLKYKISISGIVFLLIFFFLSKRFWLDDSLKRLNAKITELETLGLTVTDQTAIMSMKQRYRQYRLIDLFVKLLIPAAVLVLILMCVKALEEQAIKLFNVFMSSTVSFAVGIVFKIVEIYSMKFEHEQEG